MEKVRNSLIQEQFVHAGFLTEVGLLDRDFYLGVQNVDNVAHENSKVGVVSPNVEHVVESKAGNEELTLIRQFELLTLTSFPKLKNFWKPISLSL